MGDDSRLLPLITLTVFGAITVLHSVDVLQFSICAAEHGCVTI